MHLPNAFWARLLAAVLLVATVPLAILRSQTPAPSNEPPSLKTMAVPGPDLSPYVANQTALLQLGKAFFWDMQMGSDGVQACASCHFHAGADHRIMNSRNPGTNAAPPQTWFSSGDFNIALKATDFPFHRKASPSDKKSTVIYDDPSRATSQGIFLFKFLSVVPGSAVDNGTAIFDDTFQIGGVNIRRVEPRNTPTVINAVFNHRNFWDGRASFNFNGQTPFGLADTGAAIMVNNGSLTPTKISLPFSSLASQAVGPMLSNFEMSYDVRAWPNLGKKMLHSGIKPLAKQLVSASDSVLGPLANGSTNGLIPSVTYRSLIQSAFLPQYWNNTTQIVNVDASGKATVRTGTPSLTTDFTQIEFNFPFFFGLAVQEYERTLVSADSKYDKAKDAAPTATLTPDEVAGLNVFMNKGKCIACHSGAEFTNAAVSYVMSGIAPFGRPDANQPGVVERMLMSNGQAALYDSGFYNISLRPNSEDIGLGGTDPFGNPLSISRLAKQGSPLVSGFGFPIRTQFFEIPGPIASGERDAVDGAFKTPTLRNVDLTGPYMHNGGEATLEDVVALYNRGSNFNNIEQHPDIASLGLTSQEQAQLVAFMKALTDDRVRYEKAPFDHPQLWIPNGHPWNTDGSLMLGSNATARDVLCEVPAVGAAGGPALQTFAQLLNGITSDSNGPLGHTLSNCVIQPAPTDVTPPQSTFKGTVNGKATIAVQEMQSGLSSIWVTTNSNANIVVPEIVGQTGTVNVTYTKVDTRKSAMVGFQATDMAGNVSIYDPWDIDLTRTTGKPLTITHLCPDLEASRSGACGMNGDKPVAVGQPVWHPLFENKVRIRNGTPGLTNLRITVNKTNFQVAGLKDGETRDLDISKAMKGNTNVFSVEARGAPNGTANVVFWGEKPGTN